MTTGFRRAIIAVALLMLGLAIQAVSRTPPVKIEPFPIIKLTKDGQIDATFLRDRLRFANRKMAYMKQLEAPYSDHSHVFMMAQSPADYPIIKEAIDRELAASRVIEEQGFGAVPGLTGTALTWLSLWLIALAAAVAFQSLAFVLGAAFMGGLLHATAADLNTLTGLTAEYYLATILAALIIALLGWLGLRRLSLPAPA